MGLRRVYFSFLFLIPPAAFSILQIDPTSGIVINCDGTPAPLDTVRNALGPQSPYKINHHTLQIIMNDGEKADPTKVQQIIDTNITTVIHNATRRLNLVYDQLTGNIYDANGEQVVSPDLDLVNTTIEKSLNNFLNPPSLPPQGKVGELVVGTELATTGATLAIFIGYYGIKAVRALYSESSREMLRSYIAKAVAEANAKIKGTPEAKKTLEDATQSFNRAKERNKNAEKLEDSIFQLYQENARSFLREKVASLKAVGHEIVGDIVAANEQMQQVKKEKEFQKENSSKLTEKKLEQAQQDTDRRQSKKEIKE